MIFSYLVGFGALVNFCAKSPKIYLFKQMQYLFSKTIYTAYKMKLIIKKKKKRTLKKR